MNCRLFGWGGGLITPPSEPIDILNSQECDSKVSNFFCAFINETSEATCSSYLASPVMCDDAFAGFVINNQTCSNDEDQNFLTIISVGEFGDWIREVTRPDVPRYDDRFILEIAHYDVPDIESSEFQCVGTAVTLRHVVTAASCVDVEPSKGILVQKTETDINGPHVTSSLPVIISIHPDYLQSSEESSNIAVILVSL